MYAIMAFQRGSIKLEGSIGDLSFYKTKNNGYQVRQKGGPDAHRIATDPNYERTRENNKEFRRASSAGKLLRTTFRPLFGKSRDGSLCMRLTRIMLQIVKLDSNNDRGNRVVTVAETEVLKSFEFNAKGPVRHSVLMPIKPVIDRATGIFKVQIPAFIATNAIIAPEGTTHFKFKFGGAGIDFDSQVSELVTIDCEVMVYDSTLHGARELSGTLKSAVLTSLFVAFGIDFYQRVNGTDYLLNNEVNSGLCLIEVNPQTP